MLSKGSNLLIMSTTISVQWHDSQIFNIWIFLNGACLCEYYKWFPKIT